MGTAAASRKCIQCGLVNFAHNETCRRCGALLGADEPAPRPLFLKSTPRTIGRSIFWVVSVTAALLFACSRSLLLTSDPLEPEQREMVDSAVAVLETQGFSKEAFVLRHVATFRSTDNWWNRYMGHQEAYAATNFPFEVLTLYRPFFTVAEDDVERAAILLHESQHLLGSNEDTALDVVWRQKQQLGWTADRYGGTRVWKNTREWTEAAVPGLFRCGSDQRSDCEE